jgi:hypothetical protein
MLAGQLIVGGLESRTVTVKEQVPPNSAVEKMAWVPTAKNEPEGGLLDTAPQLPEPDAAAKLTNAPGSPPEVVFAVTTTLAGQSSVHVSEVAPVIRISAVEELLSVFGSGVAGVGGSATLKAVAVLEINAPPTTS